jgi:hypothetical protein
MNAKRDAGVAALNAANAAKKLRAAKRKAGEDAGAECESSPAEGEARSPGNVTAKLRAMRRRLPAPKRRRLRAPLGRQPALTNSFPPTEAALLVDLAELLFQFDDQRGNALLG